MFITTGSRNLIVSKFAAIVPVVCGITCAKFSNKRININKVTIKKPMDPSSWTREWLPSALDLRGLWRVLIFLCVSQLVQKKPIP